MTRVRSEDFLLQIPNQNVLRVQSAKRTFEAVWDGVATRNEELNNDSLVQNDLLWNVRLVSITARQRCDENTETQRFFSLLVTLVAFPLCCAPKIVRTVLPPASH